jgi:isopentenyl-diphosphate Delta-isomerase
VSAGKEITGVEDSADAGQTTSRRKGEHLRIVLEEQVTHAGGTLLDEVQLVHQALPELDLAEIDLGAELFGRPLAAPLMITSMTGGSARTRELNRELARAAGRCGVPFAVGSQRVMLERPESVEDFAVRADLGDGVLLGNIGGAQLLEHSCDAVAELSASIEADGLCVHLNPAQELAQPEGNRRFRGVLDAIARLVQRLDGRVLVKETGAGLSPETLERLRGVGVTAVDVAGTGGTSWTKVELRRAAAGPARQIGEAFADWGVPTAVSTIAARRVLGDQACVVASGGVVSGLDCARAIAAGASIAGVARAVLLAWHERGEEGAVAYLERVKHELRASLLLTGCRDVAALRSAPRVYGTSLRRWLDAYGWA